MTEQNYFNKIYFTTRIEKFLVATAIYYSDAVKIADMLEYSVPGKITVERPNGDIDYARETK